MAAAAMKKPEVVVLNARVVNGIIIMVSAIWGLSMVWSGYDKDYNPPAALNGAFSGVIAAVLVAGKKDKEDS